LPLAAVIRIGVGAIEGGLADDADIGRAQRNPE
jgi:hypothetical protein